MKDIQSHYHHTHSLYHWISLKAHGDVTHQGLQDLLAAVSCAMERHTPMTAGLNNEKRCTKWDVSFRNFTSEYLTSAEHTDEEWDCSVLDEKMLNTRMRHSH